MGDLTITEAIIRLHAGRLSPYAQIDGRWHLIETKPSLVALGVATAIPVTTVWDEDWATEPRFSTIVPADPANGRPAPLDMEDATDDPQVVALARRFNQLAAAAAAAPGPLTLA